MAACQKHRRSLPEASMAAGAGHATTGLLNGPVQVRLLPRNLMSGIFDDIPMQIVTVAQAEIPVARVFQ